MLSHNDLKKGIRLILDDQPYEVLDSSFVFKGRGSSIVQTKIKNLITGNVISKTFHPGEEFEIAEIEKIKVKFLYFHRDKFFFSKENNSSARFELPKETIGESVIFLKPNEIIEGVQFQSKIINISLPIKVQLKVIEAPPGVKGDRAQGGTKTVKLETGDNINVPLFIKEGDIIEVNTEKGEYVRRVEER
ncbi:MAG: elongation factor P [Candidatus Nealsonbacteria bacterium]|nr:elongation factor P [Candidatus Nealsonbacteria bacterium]